MSSDGENLRISHFNFGGKFEFWFYLPYYNCNNGNVEINIDEIVTSTEFQRIQIANLLQNFVVSAF